MSTLAQRRRRWWWWYLRSRRRWLVTRQEGAGQFGTVGEGGRVGRREVPPDRPRRHGTRAHVRERRLAGIRRSWNTHTVRVIRMKSTSFIALRYESQVATRLHSSLKTNDSFHSSHLGKTALINTNVCRLTYANALTLAHTIRPACTRMIFPLSTFCQMKTNKLAFKDKLKFH